MPKYVHCEVLRKFIPTKYVCLLEIFNIICTPHGNLYSFKKFVPLLEISTPKFVPLKICTPQGNLYPCRKFVLQNMYPFWKFVHQNEISQVVSCRILTLNYSTISSSSLFTRRQEYPSNVSTSRLCRFGITAFLYHPRTTFNFIERLRNLKEGTSPKPSPPLSP